ncbi:MAG TPA: iron-sulfur cluster assembly protein, partial [Rhodoglobus sp.]|nr:iron-sulfur cluster assembly protein [Rhodoglobus sp.]
MSSDRRSRIETSGDPGFDTTDFAGLLNQRIRESLSRVIDPELRRPVTELDMIGGVSVDEAGAASVDLKLTIVGCPAADTIERDVRAAVAGTAGVTAVALSVGVMSREEREALTDKLRGGRPKALQFGPDSLTRIYA